MQKDKKNVSVYFRMDLCDTLITSKTLNNAPQYTLRVKGWKTDIEPAGDAFAFTPPDGAKKLRPDALIELDELPQGATEGENQ